MKNGGNFSIHCQWNGLVSWTWLKLGSSISISPSDFFAIYFSPLCFLSLVDTWHMAASISSPNSSHTPISNDEIYIEVRIVQRIKLGVEQIFSTMLVCNNIVHNTSLNIILCCHMTAQIIFNCESPPCVLLLSSRIKKLPCWNSIPRFLICQ